MDPDLERREIIKSNKNENAIMSKQRILKNLFVVSIGFMLLFSAAMALQNLQSTMNNIEGIGVISQSTMYAAMLVTCLLLPKLAMKKIGCKWTITIAALMYTPSLVANLYPSKITFVPTALLAGIGAAMIWSSVNTYINQLAFRYAAGDRDKAVISSSRFFGIFQMIFPTTQIWGNLVSFYVFKPGVNSDKSQSSLDINDSVAIHCGVKFCGDSNSMHLDVSHEKRYLLTGIYIFLALVSAILFAFFLDNFKSVEQEKDSKDGILQMLSASIKQIANVDQLLMAVITINVGLNQGFLFSDFSEAYVACALGLDDVGLVFVFYGAMSSIVAISSGYAIKYVPRTAIMTAAALNKVAVLMALLIWTPSRYRVHYFVIIGFWSFSDSIWQTQLSALYGTLFRSDEEAAFACGEIFRSIGFLIAFACNTALCTAPKIYLLYGSVSLGMLGYYGVELRRKIYSSIS